MQRRKTIGERKMDQYFDDVVQGFSYAEVVFRIWCETEITKIKAAVEETVWQMLSCIYKNDKYTIGRKGRHAAMFEHECQKRPACNIFWKRFLSKLPLASKLNRTEVLSVVSGDDLWEFTKLFMEPWMRQFCGFRELDTYCLLVLLENVSSIHQDSNPSRHALYQENIGKARKLAEACMYADREKISSTDKDMCLETIINALALLQKWPVDFAIKKLKDIYGFMRQRHLSRNPSTIQHYGQRTKREEFHQKILEFKHGIPLETNESLATTEADTSVKAKLNIAEGDQDTGHEIEPHDLDKYLIMFVVTTRSKLQTLFNRHAKSSTKAIPTKSQRVKITTKEDYECIQGLVYYLEKNGGPNDTIRSLLDILKLTDRPCNWMPAAHFNTLENALERYCRTRRIKEILNQEARSRNFKVCYQTLLIVEKDLRRYCKEQIETIHSNVVTQFGRTVLCQGADKNDICVVKELSLKTFRFKHECHTNPECNRFLELILSKRSAKCSMSPSTMFKNVNPQNCIDSVWEFTKVFLDPYMRTLNGFEELDAFVLLTLFTNVVFDTNQVIPEEHLRKLGKVRDSAFNLLRSTKMELSNESKTHFFDDIIHCLRNGMLPLAKHQIQLVEKLSCETTAPIFEIRLAIVSNREQRIKEFYEKSNIRDKNISHWFRCALALKYVPPALLPIVKQKFATLHREAKHQMGRNLCKEANSEDIRKDNKRGATFKHKCITDLSTVPCQTLLDIIKTNTTDSIDMHRMVKDTDPQTWLVSPFSFASVFLKYWMRQYIVQFDDCDVSALCHIILRCKPLQTVCHTTKVDDVNYVRNRIMHSATLDIGQEDMDEHINAILLFLRHIEQHQVEKEVTEAIRDIAQLKANDLGILRYEGAQLLEEVMMSIEIERTHREAKTQSLHKKIDALEKFLEPHEESDETGNKNEVPTENFYYWCRCALALKYVQRPLMLIVKENMDSLYRCIECKFKTQRCPMATFKNIIRVEEDNENKCGQNNGSQVNNKVKFTHTCLDPECNCNELLASIQNNIPEAVDVLAMVRGTDPQTWLNSFQDFTRIFLKGWRKSRFEDIEACDITALCHIVERCQPLLNKMDGIMVAKVKSVRNKLVHCASLNIGRQEMECDIDIILKFIHSLKIVSANQAIEEAERNIEELRSGRVAVLGEREKRLLHEVLSDVELEIQYKEEEVENLRKMDSALEKLSACGDPPDQPAGGVSSSGGDSDIDQHSGQAEHHTTESPTPDIDIEVESSSGVDWDIDPPSGVSSSGSDSEIDRHSDQAESHTPDMPTPDLDIEVKSSSSVVWDIDPPTVGKRKKKKQQQEIKSKIRDLVMEQQNADKDIAELDRGEYEIKALIDTDSSLSSSVCEMVMKVTTLGLNLRIGGQLQLDTSSREECERSIRRIKDKRIKVNARRRELVNEITTLNSKLDKLR